MTIPLVFAEVNKNFTIKNITGSSKAKSELVEKGFYVGKKISLIKNLDNNFLVNMENCQYVLGFGFAKNIMIEC